ncbi:MAG: MAPEG family protein [Candidatus Caenarcaniphilales bacterium]|nr:MAPEG family protein [Candidatus Caenarcaniphilales bacterium]
MAHNEIFYLVITAMLTGLMWLPYIINRIIEEGLIPAVTQSQVEVNAKSLWGQRAYRAHMNAIENLVVFAPLVLSLCYLNLSSPETIELCKYFLFLRIAHYICYMAAVPVLRTLLFAGGVIIQIKLFVTILSSFN